MFYRRKSCFTSKEAAAAFFSLLSFTFSIIQVHANSLDGKNVNTDAWEHEMTEIVVHYTVFMRADNYKYMCQYNETLTAGDI